jgi:bifunctional DNA-binding transcriptional regulator/antitoxin component of YhaV-PrlF toxin-antitoxin module
MGTDTGQQCLLTGETGHQNHSPGPSNLYLLKNSKDSVILYSYPYSKENRSMPKVSSKRQITLPVDQCRQVGIEPGDEYQSFVANGHITIVKKIPGAARKVLKQVKGDASVTDEASRQSALD